MAGTNDQQDSERPNGTGQEALSAKPAPVPVAEYVRVSKVIQEYSIEHQQRVIRDFAQRRGMTIVHTYADAGKSGLHIRGRDGLRQLIHDVQSGRPNFQAVLVYDVSRWGRFQDTDESAYYEYLCRRARIAVHYCAEEFENDGSPVSTIIKIVKRAMAGEYSRELSTKIFAKQCRLAELGYYQGGPPGFGLRRLLLNAQGVSKGLLKFGERKSINTDRVILVPGPPDEIKIVQEIFRAFVEDRKSAAGIARSLNERGVRTALGYPWKRSALEVVLTNERYIGNNVYNRISRKLGWRLVQNPPERWIRKEFAFEPIVPRERFAKAQSIIRAGWGGTEYTNEEVLDRLRRILRREGKLTASLIDSDRDLPCAESIAAHFGSKLRAYELAGYTPLTFHHYKETNTRRGALRLGILNEITEAIQKLGGVVNRDPSTGLLTVNDEFTTLVVIALRRPTTDGSRREIVRLAPRLNPDITVIVRMDRENKSVLEYFLLPKEAARMKGLVRLTERKCMRWSPFRFPNLDPLYSLALRTNISEEA